MLFFFRLLLIKHAGSCHKPFAKSSQSAGCLPRRLRTARARPVNPLRGSAFGLDGTARARTAALMETATIHLTPDLRRYLREQIDHAVRSRRTIPERYACRGCGADIRSLTAPVVGCATCVNRLWRRRRRASCSTVRHT